MPALTMTPARRAMPTRTATRQGHGARPSTEAGPVQHDLARSRLSCGTHAHAMQFERELDREPPAAGAEPEELGCARNALEDGVSVCVQPHRGAWRVLGFFEVDPERLAQPRGGRRVGSERS